MSRHEVSQLARSSQIRRRERRFRWSSIPPQASMIQRTGEPSRGSQGLGLPAAARILRWRLRQRKFRSQTKTMFASLPAPAAAPCRLGSCVRLGHSRFMKARISQAYYAMARAKGVTKWAISCP